MGIMLITSNAGWCGLDLSKSEHDDKDHIFT